MDGALSAIIGNESIEESDVVPVLDASGLFGPVETAQFSFQSGTRSRRAARSRPLAQLPREAPAARARADSRCGRSPLRRDRVARRRETRVRHRVLPGGAELVSQSCCLRASLEASDAFAFGPKGLTMNQPFDVRPAADHDIDQLSEFLNACTLAHQGIADRPRGHPREDSPATGRNRFVTRSSCGLTTASLALRTSGGTIRDEIKFFARSHPDERGRGVGAFLVQLCEQRAFATACDPPDDHDLGGGYSARRR